MAVLLPLATLLLGKALSKTEQHKAVCFAVRCLPSPLHGADDTCKILAPPQRAQALQGNGAAVPGGAVGTPLMGCWAGNCTPGPHLYTLKPCLTWLIWDTVLRGTVPLDSPSAVLCRTRPLVNKQSYRVRTSRLETFQVSELKVGVIWGDFSWLINPGSHLRKTAHLTTDFICCFPAHVVFTPGLSANGSDFHRHLHLTCKLYSVGTTVNDLKEDAP